MKRHDAERPSEREAIEATAAAWLAERDDGLTPVREREFRRWCAADSRHSAAVARLEATWSTLQQLRDFRPEAREHPDRDLLARAPAGVARFPAVASAGLLAAALAIAATLWLVGTRTADAPSSERYATTVDGYERVTLEDGSLLELNADSAVSVRFTPAERRVRLLRGEAHFTVAKNPARPFSVEAGAVSVRAVGTAFNVRLGASDVEVLVTEGKVEVSKIVGPALAAVPSRSERDAHDGTPTSGGPTPLSANERALISLAPAGDVPPLLEKIAPEAVREALAWQGPRLIFVDRPLSDVVAQFNRRNHVQLVLADVDLETLPIGGSFRAENVEAFIRLLKIGGEVVDDRSEPGRIVLRKAKPASRPPH